MTEIFWDVWQAARFVAYGDPASDAAERWLQQQFANHGIEPNDPETEARWEGPELPDDLPTDDRQQRLLNAQERREIVDLWKWEGHGLSDAEQAILAEKTTRLEAANEALEESHRAGEITWTGQRSESSPRETVPVIDGTDGRINFLGDGGLYPTVKYQYEADRKHHPVSRHPILTLGPRQGWINLLVRADEIRTAGASEPSPDKTASTVHPVIEPAGIGPSPAPTKYQRRPPKSKRRNRSGAYYEPTRKALTSLAAKHGLDVINGWPWPKIKDHVRMEINPPGHRTNIVLKLPEHTRFKEVFDAWYDEAVGQRKIREQARS